MPRPYQRFGHKAIPKGLSILKYLKKYVAQSRILTVIPPSTFVLLVSAILLKVNDITLGEKRPNDPQHVQVV